MVSHASHVDLSRHCRANNVWGGFVSCAREDCFWHGDYFLHGPAALLAWTDRRSVFSKLSIHCLWRPCLLPLRDLGRRGGASLQKQNVYHNAFIMRVPSRFWREVGRFLDLGSRTTSHSMIKKKFDGFEHVPYVVSNKNIRTDRVNGKLLFLGGCGWCLMPTV